MAQEDRLFVYLVHSILILLCIWVTHVVHAFFICQPSDKPGALPMIREVDLLATANYASTGDDASVDV